MIPPSLQCDFYSKTRIGTDFCSNLKLKTQGNPQFHILKRIAQDDHCGSNLKTPIDYFDALFLAVMIEKATQTRLC